MNFGQAIGIIITPRPHPRSHGKAKILSRACFRQSQKFTILTRRPKVGYTTHTQSATIVRSERRS